MISITQKWRSPGEGARAVVPRARSSPERGRPPKRGRPCSPCVCTREQVMQAFVEPRATSGPRGSVAIRDLQPYDTPTEGSGEPTVWRRKVFRCVCVSVRVQACECVCEDLCR